jgi:hypothetical protein
VGFVDVIGSYPGYFYRYENLHVFKDILEDTLIKRNYWWFTLFWNIGSAVFLSVYYYKILETKRFKKIIKIVAMLFIIVSAAYIFKDYSALFRYQMPIINILGGIVVLNCIALYFIEVLTTDKILNFLQSFNSIVSSTLFIWWLIITPLIFYHVYFNKGDDSFVKLNMQVYFFANLFMYSMFSFALVHCQPENEK